MTKEQFIDNILYCVKDMRDETAQVFIEEFFDTNVVIPKGENRHPYADVLHEWIEDTSKKLQSFEYLHFTGKYYWSNCDIKYVIKTTPTKLRIKPPEPVYEWQWYKILDGEVLLWENGYFDNNSTWATEDEVAKTLDTSWKKFEETKRERKCNI